MPLQTEVIKINPVLLADEFTSSKNTCIAKLAKMWLKRNFLKLFIVVIWSVTPKFYYFYFFSTLEGTQILF